MSIIFQNFIVSPALEAVWLFASFFATALKQKPSYIKKSEPVKGEGQHLGAFRSFRIGRLSLAVGSLTADRRLW